MNKKDLADHFGNYAEAARQLGRTRSAIAQWPEELPENLQFEIEARTKGKLKVDKSIRHKPAA